VRLAPPAAPRRADGPTAGAGAPLR